MSEYAGRIAVGAIVAVALVVGLAFELNYLVPNNASTTSSGTFTSGWFGNEAPPPGCGNMTLMEHLTGYRTGYIMDMYTSPTSGGGQNYLLGSTICFYTYFQNVRNQSSSLPSSETLEVSSSNQTAAASVPSHTVPETINFESSCPVPAYSGSFGANSIGWNCEVVWDTSQPYNGTLPIAGSLRTNGLIYDAQATVIMSNSTATYHTAVAFGLTATSPESTTTSSTSVPALSCPGQTFKLLAPLQTGSLSLKVVTDQGAIVNNNGTVFITHRATNGTSSNYCLRLQGNATGYVQLSANDGLPQTGTYNVTLFAGYQGPGYEGAIPSISISTNTVVTLTISVPSGEVYVVTSTQGVSLVTTTTTTATSIEGNG